MWVIVSVAAWLLLYTLYPPFLPSTVSCCFNWWLESWWRIFSREILPPSGGSGERGEEARLTLPGRRISPPPTHTHILHTTHVLFEFIGL